MPMYNLIEYSDNCLDTSRSLFQLRKEEVPANNVDLTTAGSESFKYKVDFLGKTANAAGGNCFVKNVKIAVPLNYLSNF